MGRLVGGVARSVAGVIAASLIIMSGCGATGEPSPRTSGSTGPLRLAVESPIKSLDPAQSFYLVEYGMAELLMRPLPDGTVTGWLARSVSPSPDLKTWTIVLNDGIRFHNGTAVNAAAVAACLQRTIDAGEAEITKGTAAATDDQTLTLTLPEPNSQVAEILASRYEFPIYDVAALPADPADSAAIATAGIYTGPFKPEAPTTSRMSAPANPDYWQGKPAVAGLTLLFVPDADARVATVQAGEADIALSAPAEAAQTVGGDAVFVVSDKTPHARALLPHVTAAPMDDPRVRQAVFLAIDYQSMARDVLGAGYLPASGFYPPGIPFRKDNYVHDPARAAALLDAAGWRVEGSGRTRNGVPLELRYIFEKGDPDSESIGIGLRDMLSKINVRLELQSVESLYNKQSFPALWHLASRESLTQGINNSRSDGVNYLVGATSCCAISEINDSGVERFLTTYQTSADPTERGDLLGNVQSLLYDRGLVVALAFEKPKAVTSKRWRNFEPTYSAPVIWYNVAPTGG